MDGEIVVQIEFPTFAEYLRGEVAKGDHKIGLVGGDYHFPRRQVSRQEQIVQFRLTVTDEGTIVVIKSKPSKVAPEWLKGVYEDYKKFILEWSGMESYEILAYKRTWIRVQYVYDF